MFDTILILYSRSYLCLLSLLFAYYKTVLDGEGEVALARFRLPNKKRAKWILRHVEIAFGGLTRILADKPGEWFVRVNSGHVIWGYIPLGPVIARRGIFVFGQPPRTAGIVQNNEQVACGVLEICFPHTPLPCWKAKSSSVRASYEYKAVYISSASIKDWYAYGVRVDKNMGLRFGGGFGRLDRVETVPPWCRHFGARSLTADAGVAAAADADWVQGRFPIVISETRASTYRWGLGQKKSTYCSVVGDRPFPSSRRLWSRLYRKTPSHGVIYRRFYSPK